MSEPVKIVQALASLNMDAAGDHWPELAEVYVRAKEFMTKYESGEYIDGFEIGKGT